MCGALATVCHATFRRKGSSVGPVVVAALHDYLQPSRTKMTTQPWTT